MANADIADMVKAPKDRGSGEPVLNLWCSLRERRFAVDSSRLGEFRACERRNCC
jgi:hypothetical protein